MLHALTRSTRPIPNWRPLAWFAGAAALLLLAAWSVPPMLDWGRFRTAIASIAAARLGRPVVIGGDISLRLLPQAVLTASDVMLADPGDGISVQVAALRLQVATLPLIAGRVVVRDLVLSAPVLHVPWSLPRGIGQSARPQLPHAFAARVENGRLRIGEAEVTGITATLHAGPTIGVAETATPDGVPVAAFGAEGFAAAGGRSWRFTAALGAPDADGVSAVDIAVRGQGVVADTGGSVQGTLADGVVQGRLRAGGPDLSLLMPASAASWTAEAPFVADATRIEANAISLSLGGAPADGALVLHLDAPGENAPAGGTPGDNVPAGGTPGVVGSAEGRPGKNAPGGVMRGGGAQGGNSPARLEGHLHAASLDLNGWAALLGRSLRAAPGPGSPIPMQVGLSAESARLLDGKLSYVQATLVSDGHSLGFDHAKAGLPGGARLSSDRVELTRTEDGQLAASGTASLSAPDLHTTLVWLRRLAPALEDAIPGDVLRQADLNGVLTLQAGRGSVTGLTGRLDGEPVSGELSLLLEGQPSLAATLTFADLPLDTWLDDARLGEAGPAGSLAGFARHFTRAETSLHIKAEHVALHGQVLDDLDLTARTGAAGLQVERAQAGLDGAKLSLAGSLAPDGKLAGIRFRADAAALEGVLSRLPAPWRLAPGLWHGAGSLQAAADGPAAAVSLQVRADAGDLVLEADSVRDTRAGTGTTTVTLRHPGAPRLIAELGLPQALGLPAGLAQTAQWLDTGALTLRAHFEDSPHHLDVQDFDLDAAAFRVSGKLTADWSGPAPALAGSLAFDQLALPDDFPDLVQAAGLAAWTTRFHVNADSVTVGLRQVASNAALDVDGAGGKMRIRSVTADSAGGKLTGQADADLASTHFTTNLRLMGAKVAGKLTGWPIDLVSGNADLSLMLDLAGSSLGTLSGAAHVQLRDASARGFDLAQLTAAAPLRTKAGRLALRMALSQGTSSGLAGAGDATISNGTLTLSAARLSSGDGVAEVTGGADLARATVDARFRFSPVSPGAGGFGVRLSGPWQAPSLLVEDGSRRR